MQPAPDSAMSVFVTGASGYIGGSVAERLVALGHRVRGLTRRQDSAALLAARGIEPVVGSLDDSALLAHEARQAGAVIDTASADHPASALALIDALRGSGKALIHTSGSSVVGDDARAAYVSDRVVSDDDGDFPVSPAKQARRDIDLRVLAAAGEGVRACVICPGLVYGVGRGLHRDSVQIPLLASHARQQGVVQIVGAGLNVWSHVYLDDLVELYLLALRAAPADAFYFADGGEAAFIDVGRALARRLQLPGPESLAPDLAAQRWGEARAYYSFGSNSRVRGARARRELHWSPTGPSLLDWIAQDMPVDSANGKPAAPPSPTHQPT